MSPVCVLDGKYEPRADDRLENIFPSDRRPEVHIFHLEHRTSIA